jgi:hypothetical protein
MGVLQQFLTGLDRAMQGAMLHHTVGIKDPAENFFTKRIFRRVYYISNNFIADK